MCLSLQGNLYIFIVGHSEGTVRRQGTVLGDRGLFFVSETSPVSALVFRGLNSYGRTYLRENID